MFTETERNLYYTYIMSNTNNSVLYTGVTNILRRRVEEHRMKINPYSFTSIYKVHKLVFYEEYKYVHEAIAREKQIKGGSRKKKIDLIEKSKKEWVDLYYRV